MMENFSSLSKRGLKLKESFNDEITEIQCSLSDISEGIINLGVSENRVMYDVLKPKLQEPASRDISEHLTHYCDFKGTYEFRTAIAEFFDYYMKPVEKVNPNNLVVLNGCNTIVEAMGSIVADPGEGILIPSPFYGGFTIDLKLRAEVVSVPVYLSEEPAPGESGPFQLSSYRLEKAMEEAYKQKITIKALLLCNPNNPFGNIYSKEVLQECLEFAHRHSIHVIIDEIYLLSIYKEGHSMTSMLAMDSIPDKQFIHVIWGFSKDFGISGFRCGVLHSWNKEVLAALRWITYLQSVPTSTQCLLMNLISDKDWIDNVYMPTNHQRLSECCQIVCDGLTKARIPYVESYAGLFIWADFREFVPSKTFKEEKKVFDRFLDAKIYITPGIAFSYNQPGWFRLVFATNPEQLKIGMERIITCANAIREEQKINNCKLTTCIQNSSTTNNTTVDDEILDGGGESLEDLAQALQVNMRNSNWLSINTAEKWTKENPELAEVFLKNISPKE